MDSLRTYCVKCYKLGHEPLADESHTFKGTIYGICADCITKSCVDCGKSYQLSDMHKGHSLTGVPDEDNYICTSCYDKARDEEE